MLADRPVGAKGLDKFALRSIRLENREEERRQFFYDVHIDPWNWFDGVRSVEDLLRGKRIPSLRFARYRVLGWIRPLDRAPGYELTCAGEQVFMDEKDEWDFRQRDDDDYDFDYFDDDDDFPDWEGDDDEDDFSGT